MDTQTDPIETEQQVEPLDLPIPQRGAAILLALARRYYRPNYPPQNRADRRARGERGYKYGLGSMAVPKSRNAR